MSLRLPTVGLLCAATLVLACADHAPDPVEAAGRLPSFARKPGDPGAAAGRQLYQVRLAAEPGSRANGVMFIEIVGGYITATVHAAGLMPDRHIPQHIHVNPTCNPGGGILLNLDANLTIAGEGPGVGDMYPLSNRAGVVNYYAQRLLTDLMAAVNNIHEDADLTTVDDLLAWLNLEERNGHMHVATGPPFPAVNCGEVRRLN
jgi:hypothetical protein